MKSFQSYIENDLEGIFPAYDQARDEYREKWFGKDARKRIEDYNKNIKPSSASIEKTPSTKKHQVLVVGQGTSLESDIDKLSFEDLAHKYPGALTVVPINQTPPWSYAYFTISPKGKAEEYSSNWDSTD